jgi:hypothetical protein
VLSESSGSQTFTKNTTMSEKLDPNELMFLAGEGELMVRDATTGQLFPLSELEDELKKAEQKIKNQSRCDASTGVCWWQDPNSSVVFVLRIIKDSPAALTRIKPGDALVKVLFPSCSASVLP